MDLHYTNTTVYFKMFTFMGQKGLDYDPSCIFIYASYYECVYISYSFSVFLFYMNWCSEDNNKLIYALFIGG